MKTVKTIANGPYQIHLWMNDGFWCIDIYSDDHDDSVWSSKEDPTSLGWREMKEAESFARKKTNMWIATEKSLNGGSQ